MITDFQLPKLWYIKGDHNNIEAAKAWNKLAGDGYSFLNDCIYYFNERGKDEYTRGKAPKGYTEISLDDFIRYIVNKEPVKPFVQDSKYNEILIKLLTK